MLNRSCVAEGSTEASSPLLSVGGLGGLLLNTPLNTKGNTSKPFKLVFDECVTLRHIGQNTFIKIELKCNTYKLKCHTSMDPITKGTPSPPTNKTK